jgi:hypothetical protein
MMLLLVEIKEWGTRADNKSTYIEIFECKEHAIKCFIPHKVTVNKIVIYYKFCNIPTAASPFTKLIVFRVSFVGPLSTKKTFCLNYL